MRARRLAILALGALVAACGALQPQAPEPVSLHVLAARPALPTAAPRPREVVIEVAAPRAWPGFDSDGIVYTRSPFELDRFATHRWVDTPPRMLAPLLVRALEDTGGFRAVVTAPASATADYRLDTEVVRLVQDFGTRPSRVEIAVRAQLTDLRPRRPAGSRLFEAVEVSPSEDAGGGVAAANAALARVLAELAQFCLDQTARR